MVSGNEHQRSQDDSSVISLPGCRDHIIKRRAGFNRSDEEVLLSHTGKSLLHSVVYPVCRRFGPVAHQHDSGLPVVILSACPDQSTGDSGKILIACQKRRSQCSTLKLPQVLIQYSLQLVILKAAHEVSRLNDESIHAVTHSPLQCLAYIVYPYALPLSDDVYYHLRGESPAHGKPANLFYSLFYRADIQSAGLFRSRPKADNKYFSLHIISPYFLTIGASSSVLSEPAYIALP